MGRPVHVVSPCEQHGTGSHGQPSLVLAMRRKKLRLRARINDFGGVPAAVVGGAVTAAVVGAAVELKSTHLVSHTPCDFLAKHCAIWQPVSALGQKAGACVQRAWQRPLPAADCRKSR